MIPFKSQRGFKIDQLEEWLNKLAIAAEDKFPDRSWTANIILWDDMTSHIRLESARGNLKDIFELYSLNEKVIHRVERLGTDEGCEVE